MKKLFLILLFFTVANICNATGSGYVRLEGKQFKYGNGDDFYPVLMNYYVSLSYNTIPITDPSHVDINPWNNFGTTSGFEHADGHAAIETDFAEIKSLGFNSIRLIFGIKRYNEPVYNPDTRKYTSPCYPAITSPLFTFDWFLPSNNLGNNECFAIQSPYISNANFLIYLQKVDEVLAIAEQENLKVIFLTADGFELFNGNGKPPSDPTAITNQDAVDDYKEFLEALTAHFANDTTIMAYDLDNEPHYKDGGHGLWNRRKNEVCDFTTQLYNAIKLIDPNHLITIGLGDEGTVETWDPEVIKADFVCLHLYPYFRKGKDFNNHTEAMHHLTDRLFAKIYWVSKFVNKPWILGETGFTSVDASVSEDYWSWYGINGNYSQLGAFISRLLGTVKNCGVSGIAWWNFQDSFSSSNPPTDHDPTHNDAYGFREECWGLLKKGDPVGTDYSNSEKLSQSPFSQFNQIPSQLCNVAPPETYSENDVYYDCYQNHIENPIPPSPLPTSWVSGQVLDQNSNPIEGSIIVGQSWLTTILGSTPGEPDNYITYPITTFTDKYGNYTLIPFNFGQTNFNDHRIIKVAVSGFGLESLSVSSIDDSPVSSIVNFANRKRTSLHYNSQVEIDPPIMSTESEFYEGWNSVNITGEIDGTGNITARQEINLLDGFYAKNESEVHVYTSEVFLQCVDFTGYRIAQNSQINGLSDTRKIISLSFTEDKKDFKIIVYPMPNSGEFSLNLVNINPQMNTTLTIRNISGNRIFQTATNQMSLKLNLTSLSKGVYILEGTNQNSVCVEKLIIQ